MSPATLHGERRVAADRAIPAISIFDIAALIEFASSFYTLYPGDVYFTGTPAGVGPVKPGDVIKRAPAIRIGTLEIKVRAHEIGA